MHAKGFFLWAMSSIYGCCCRGRYPLPRPDRLQNVREDRLHFRSLYILIDRSVNVPCGKDLFVSCDRSFNAPRGAMRASPPTLKTHVFCRGRCPHRPVAGGMGVSVLSDRFVNVPYGAMRASPPTLKTHVFCRGRCPHRPESRRFRIGKTKCSSLLMHD